MSNLLDLAEPPVYNLLSIGQRGAGKTVFLVASYVDLHSQTRQGEKGRFWFDCEELEVQQTIDNVLKYIAKTGQYPPATLKLTNFNFNLKQLTTKGIKTHCQVCWWDTPGESCQIYNPAFLTMVVNANGVCLFLDAKALVEQADDQRAIAAILNPVTTLAEILAANQLSLPLALILTKCDLLQAQTCHWQTLKKSLHSLTTQLDAFKLPHRFFYSALPLQQQNKATQLQANQAGMPIYWLIEQMHRNGQSSLANSSLLRIESTKVEVSSGTFDNKESSVGKQESPMTESGVIGVAQKETELQPQPLQLLRKPQLTIIKVSKLKGIHQKIFILSLLLITSAIGIISTLAIEGVVQSQQAPARSNSPQPNQ